MEINIYTDGGSINNPGPAASSFLIYINKKLVIKKAVYLGEATNNFAEYSALIFALEKTREIVQTQKAIKIICFSDSLLMINQVNGLFKVKNKTIRDFLMKIRILEQEINIPIVYKHIPREENQKADDLVKKCLFNSKF